MIRICFLMLAMIVVNSIAQGQSKTFEKFMEDELTGHRFFFYPSTLRMLNLTEDPTFYEAIKGVKKLVFFKLIRDRFSDADLRKAMLDLKNEAFEAYLTIEDGAEDRKIYVVGKDHPFETIVLAKQDGDYYAADLQGSVDLLNLAKIYQKLAEEDEQFSEGFINVFDFMGDN